MRQAVPQPVLLALCLAGNVLLLAAGWFVVVAPQRHHASRTAHSVAITQAQIAQAKSFSRPTPGAAQPKQPAIHTSLLYRITKAMPDSEDQPDLLLQLDGIARASGVAVTSIAPGEATAGTGYSIVPITLSAQGDFYSLTDMLYRLRALVAVHHGALDAAGRLFSVESVTLTPVGKGRQLTADVTVDAFVYGTTLAGSTTPATTTSSTSTTSTTSTSTTGTTSSTTTGASG